MVAEALLSKYLVKTTKDRVLAYRVYREQRGEYWTAEKLERHHWEWLYAQVSLERTLVAQKSGTVRSNTKRMISIREALCRESRIAEELVPLHNR